MSNYFVVSSSFLFTFLEFNNRNALFVSGDWKLSQTQYVIEWVTLLILLFIIIAYIATTLTFHLKGKFYYLQLFMGSILFFKLLTEFINIMIHGLLLSVFITPTLLLMLLAIIISYSLQFTRATIIKSIIKVLSIKHFDVYAIS